MRIGFALPNIGPVATAEAVAKVAQRAESLGYESLWTIERLLWPLKPQTPYPATPDGLLPEFYKHILDPLDTLTFAAASTKKIALGPSVLDIPYHNPVVLARRLTTIDFLSNGRLRLGLGLGWSKDEMDATGADLKKRGAIADEFIQVLKTIWTTDPVEFNGKFYKVPKSYISRSRCRSRIRPFTWRHSRHPHSKGWPHWQTAGIRSESPLMEWRKCLAA